jgi:hypothetical protein
MDYRCEKCGNVVLDFLNRCSNLNCGSDQISVDLESGIATCQKCGSEWSIYESGNPELVNILRGNVTCQHCKHEGQALANLDCIDRGSCKGTPDPYTIYDIQMTLRRIDKRTEITHWKIQPPDPRLFDPNSQGWTARSEDQAAAKALAEANQRPIDLDDEFAPMSATQQAQILEVRNPFGLNTAQDTAKYRTPNVEEYGDNQ